jgi:hypothetical protein
MSELGHRPIWEGPVEQTPWWWSFVIQIEKYIHGLRESAAYDFEKKTPPKDLWNLASSEKLDSEWYEPRRKEGERLAREKQPLDNWG